MIKFKLVGRACNKGRPGVVAIIDGSWCTKWNPSTGWTCTCPSPDENCGHPDAVSEQLDDRVLTDIIDWSGSSSAKWR